jgi:hypothetical protein
MAGYSKRPLVEKLGIKEGAMVLILDAPENYDQALAPFPEKASRFRTLQKSLDFIQFFTKEKQQLLRQFPELKKHLSPKGILWISWPKGASKIKTDLNENVVRAIGLANGMVDIKVCAVDDIWSGLRFAFRRK